MQIDGKEVETVYQKRDDGNGYITIKWRMTEWCNYRCSYCIRSGKQTADREADSVMCTRAERINNIAEQTGKDFNLDLIGGEVTFFDLPSILDNISSEHFKALNITTNFSADIDVYKKLISYCEERSIEIRITISLHEEYTTASELVEKVNELGDGKKYVKIEFVLTKDNESSATELKLLCEKNGIKRHYDICRNTDNTTEVSSEQISSSSSSLKKTPRYLVFSDGTNGKTAKNTLFTQTDGICGFPSKGRYCYSSTIYIRLTKIRTRSCRTYETILKDIDDEDETPNYSVIGDICVCPNDYCMLCGNPVVTTNKDRIQELIDAGEIA